MVKISNIKLNMGKKEGNSTILSKEDKFQSKPKQKMHINNVLGSLGSQIRLNNSFLSTTDSSFSLSAQ
jgi:hypothetical protein